MAGRNAVGFVSVSLFVLSEVVSTQANGYRNSSVRRPSTTYFSTELRRCCLFIINLLPDYVLIHFASARYQELHRRYHQDAEKEERCRCRRDTCSARKVVEDIENQRGGRSGRSPTRHDIERDEGLEAANRVGDDQQSRRR